MSRVRCPKAAPNSGPSVCRATESSLLAASAACRDRRRRIHDRQEIGLPAHDLAQPAPGADFIVPTWAPRRAADADGADQLFAIDDDWQSAPLGEIAERPLPELGGPSRHGVRRSPARLARVECGLGLEKCRRDSLLALAVHAIEVNLFAKLIQNGDAHPHAFLFGFGHAGLRDLL